MPKDEDDCGDKCKENAGVIVTDEICQSLQEKSNINCQELAQKVLNKEITPLEYVDTIIEHADGIGDKDNADIIRKIKELMYGQ